ncbi:hypothetical protein FRB93_007027 [Tulasnella sp. JGI-2019a]|nr:hypothetical protein FRB93_007027 [Tulasnella sp. JGI-2019a]
MSSSTATTPLAFEKTSMTYEVYTSLPFRPIRHLHPFSPEEIRNADWATVSPGETHQLIKGLVTNQHGVTMDDIRKVKGNIEPAFHLDLTLMSRAGLLPKPFPTSQPTLEYDHLEVSSPIELHQHIETGLLVNLAYSFRLRRFLQELSVLPQLEDDVMGFEEDPQVKALVGYEATTACDVVWERLQVFSKEKQLGLATWLWANTGTVTKMQTGEGVTASGSVLFTYAPHWVLTEQALEDMRKPGALTNPSASTWFTGIHATCRRSGARHLAIYTGNVLVIAIFNAAFDEVFFSPSLSVTADIAHSHNLTPSSFCEIDVCLGQVLTQLLCDARDPSISLLADSMASTLSSAQVTAPSLPFPLANFVAASFEQRSPVAQRKTHLKVRDMKPKSRAEPYPKPSNRHRSVPESHAGPSLRSASGRKAAPLPVQERPRIVSDPRFNPCNLITLSSTRPKRLFADVDIGFPSVIGGSPSVMPQRVVAPASSGLVRTEASIGPHFTPSHPSAGLVRTEAFIDLRSIPSRPSAGLVRTKAFRDLSSIQSRPVFEGPPIAKRRKLIKEPALPQHGPVFYSAKARKAHDRDLAKLEARNSRRALNTARTSAVTMTQVPTAAPAAPRTEVNSLAPAPVPASFTPPVVVPAPVPAAASVPASSRASVSTSSTLAKVRARRENRLDVVAQASKKAQLGAALGAVKRTAYNGMRRVLNMRLNRTDSDKHIDAGVIEDLVANAGKANESDGSAKPVEEDALGSTRD